MLYYSIYQIIERHILDMAADQIVEQLTTLPDSAHYLWATIPIAAAYTAYSIRKDFNGVSEDRADTQRNFEGANQAVFDRVIEDTAGAPATQRAYSRWYRVGHRVLLASGLAVLGASLVSQPKVDIVTHVSDGTEIAVLDTSLSMIDTKDMSGHLTRFEAAQQALEDTSFPGEFGVVQFGATAVQTIPLGPKNNSEISKLGSSKTENEVDPNGGDASDAISQAIDDLPTRKHNPNLRSGEIVIFSDGTVQPSNPNTGNSIAADAAQAKAEGVTVKVIVPGAKKAHYYTQGTGPYPDGREASTYSAFGLKNVIATTNSQDVTKESAVDAAALVSDTESQETYYPPYVLGLGAIGVAKFIEGRRIRKKRS
jgi:predicted RecA/RadA family phage recombinase